MTTDNIVLTREQQECVNYSAGDLLVKGVAGSGKSVVILKRAIQLHKKEPNATLKIITYANTLVQYTNELFSAKMGAKTVAATTADKFIWDLYFKMFGPTQINYKSGELASQAQLHYKHSTNSTHRFMSTPSDFWAEEFLWIQGKCITTKEEYISTSRRGRGAQVRIAGPEEKAIVWDMYQIFLALLKRSNSKTMEQMCIDIINDRSKIPASWKQDYIFIDEAQDLTLGKLRVLKLCCNKTLTIAADMAQKLYKTSFTWKEAGIDVTGRASKSLHKSFRSTRQIVLLAEDLMAANRKESDLRSELTDAILPEVNGPKPMLYPFGNKTKRLMFLYKFLDKMVKDGSGKSIGIICRTKTFCKNLQTTLNNCRIPYQEIIKGQDWKLLEPGVKVVTSHSSKGLEFDIVILPDFDNGYYPMLPASLEDEQKAELLATERNLAYVAMTRARERLIILADIRNKSPFIDEFKADHYDIMKP